MRSQVKVNVEKGNIIIKLNEEADQKEILDSLKKKVAQIKKAQKDSKMSIIVLGKALTDAEKVEVRNVIQEKIDIKVSFELPQELGLSGIKRSYVQDIESSVTKFYRGAVRSGQRLEYEGSIVILGDVNSGAEVMASDNVVVLGVLRGLAHAGASGNKKAIISAASIDCKQIRIADVIKQIEDEKDEDGNIIAVQRRTYAYVEKDTIVLE